MKQILLLLGGLIFFNTFAQDFSFEYEGQTLIYTIISEEYKTCQTKAGERDWNTGIGTTGNPEISGKLIIPETAMNGNIPYRVVAIGNNGFTFGKMTSIVIPSSITYIGDYAFKRCRYLKNITIDNSISSIGEYAFQECTALTTINMGDSIKYIDNYAFQGCNDLTSIVIPNSVLSIGNNSFQDCTSLKSVNIGTSVTSIGQSAFSGCTRLSTITIPDSVDIIHDNAFYGCNSITYASIGRSVKSIGKSAFQGCSLKEVFINSSNLIIKEDAFFCRSLVHAEFSSIEDLCGFKFTNANSNPLTYAHHLYIDGIEITNLVIPNSVNSIGNYAFRGCYFLTSVKIPESVTSIGKYAFCYCDNLHSLSLPNSLLSIGGAAFYGCNLSSLILPSSVTYIGEKAFESRYLISVFYNSEEPIEINEWQIFEDVENIGETTTLYVPESAVEKCSKIYPWKNFHSIQGYDFSKVDEIIDSFNLMIPLQVYDLHGILVDTNIDSLKPGIYIIVQNNKKYKIQVK